MPNHRTFEIPPIAKLLIEELGIFWKKTTIDPFPFPFKKDALTYLKTLKTNSVGNLVFDPPYTLRQLKEMYENLGRDLTSHESKYYWKDLKDEIQRVTKKNSKVISFGYNTVGIGKKRGFEPTRIMLVCHGGHHYDTLCTVEVKR